MACDAMNNNPKVSVIIPVFNTEKYLCECLDCVVNQTLKEIEIICVDDGSTDRSLDILREYETYDKRIHVLTQKKSNAGDARNKGLSIATGEYLSFLDSDDFFELTMLEHMYTCAKNRNADIVVCEMKVFDEKSGDDIGVDWHIRRNLLPKKTVFSFSDIQRNAFRCIVSYAWEKLIKRELITENHIQFQSQAVYNDALFVYKTMMSAESITVLDEYLIYNRRRAEKNSLTDIRYKHIDCAYQVLHELQNYLMDTRTYDRYKRDFICYAIHLMHHTYLGNKNDSAIREEMCKKIELWLEEFSIIGHKANYYYELSEYQKLLKKVNTQSTVAECARIQREST